ncbi:MAG TPA: periplasmic heavy metal sensor [Deltaproteobacteria bacterium]|nr:periplasmic heavy metal sensor [Deltaproteobacteria bacterium]
MMKKTGMLLIGMMILLCPVVTKAWGDGPPGRWWQVPSMADKVGVSQSEKEALDSLYVQNRRTLIDLKSNVEKERFELDNILGQQNFNERAALNQFQKLEQQREKLSMERFRYLLQVRKILGQERYQRLMSMAREFHQKRERSRGGPPMRNE